MFAIDHDKVTKVYLFSDFDHIAYALYGAGKEPIVEKKAVNTRKEDNDELGQRQMV